MLSKNIKLSRAIEGFNKMAEFREEQGYKLHKKADRFDDKLRKRTKIN